MYFAFRVVIVSTFLSAALGVECPDDWVTFQGSCYVFIDDIATWTGGQTICSLLNSHLVEIETEAENDFVVGQMKLRNVGKAWMGLNDFVREGQYVWTSSNEMAEYTNWSPGEPNDDATSHQLGDQDCGAIYNNGKWDDEYCESTHRQKFFCEHTPTEEGGIIG